MRTVSQKQFLELLEVLARFNEEYVVSSNPNGCPEGYAKVYLRRKRVTKPGEILRVHLIMSDCLPALEVEKLKEELRDNLKWLEVL